jgi:hypothetical protein
MRRGIIISAFAVTVFTLVYNTHEKEAFKSKLDTVEYDFYRIDDFNIIVSLAARWDITP